MDLSSYHHTAAPSYAMGYLWPVVKDILAKQAPGRVFELGCGNGSIAAKMAAMGYSVTAVDPSDSGIRIARQMSLSARFESASTNDDLAARFGRFPCLVSLEVVEHVIEPRRFAKVAFDLVESGGVAIISTPFHGYWKNLAIALSGNFDKHFNPLWDGGHIKFWSQKTLERLLREAGFTEVRFAHAGRIPFLAKSMIAIAVKPS